MIVYKIECEKENEEVETEIQRLADKYGYTWIIDYRDNND